MLKLKPSQKQRGFTVVELAASIVIISILAGAVIVSYGDWQSRITVSQLKSDLNGVSSAMENARNFGNGYPATVPSTFIPSSGVTLSGGNLNSGLGYCVSAKSGIQSYFVTSDYSVPLAGVCPVFSIDAGISSSYSGTGVSWVDLSGNDNNATLVNGPTYNGAGGKSIVFDGSNDYADFNAPNLTTTATVEMWAKIGSSYTQKMFFGWNTYDVYADNVGSIGYNTSNGDVFGIPAATATALGVANNWKQYIFEMRSDVSYTNNKMYINGALQTLSQVAATEKIASRTFNGGSGRIAWWRYTFNDNYNMPMEVGVFRVYNRALTQSEVTQSFNAQRSRYGI